MPTAIILLHVPHEGAYRLRPALERAGFRVVERLGPPSPGDARAELVVLMGGPMGVYEADRHPQLAAELELLSARLRAGRPSLGICLGAQLLAHAAGARVFPGAAGLELGVMPVRVTDEGARDPLFAGIPAELPVAHWHGDTFEPVPGATLLASTGRYPQQAFRIGRSLGLQFHPELDVAALRGWLALHPEAPAQAGKSLAGIEAEELPRLEAAGAHLDRLLDNAAAALARS